MPPKHKQTGKAPTSYDRDRQANRAKQSSNLETPESVLLKIFCIVDDGKPSFPEGVPSFSVKILDTETVDDLKKAVKEEKKPQLDMFAADELTLKFIPNGITKEELGKLVKGSLVELDNELEELSTYFPEKPVDRLIHIVVEPPKRGILDVIKNIQCAFHPRVANSVDIPLLSQLMPLRERPMAEATEIVVQNVLRYLNRNTARTESEFLVCSGTAGIGKTRYGQELYRALENDLSSVIKRTTAKEPQPDYSPYCYYMMLNFSNGVKLGLEEDTLDPEHILGLRLAYCHFIRNKYQEQFSDFRFKALRYKGLFTISNVIIAIRQDLGLSDDQEFVLFLHIDEYQMIFDYHWNGTPKRKQPLAPPVTRVRLAGDKTENHTVEGLSLFKGLTDRLGHFMSGETNPSIIQTFLSGTARQEVTRSAQPTSYTFHFLDCPTLSMGARYDILGFFANRLNISYCEWMSQMKLFHLLFDTGGLPRALQFLLERFFGTQSDERETFLEVLRNIDTYSDDIISEVAEKLDRSYQIKDFAKNNKEIVCALTQLRIAEQPVPRTHAPCEQFPAVTLDVLERDTHTILEGYSKNDETVLVRIPYFFLYLYEKVVRNLSRNLGFGFLVDWKSDRGWKFFEKFIAEYEVYRTNALVSLDKKAVTLRELYRGALGSEVTLNHTVKLRHLDLVEAPNQFPSSPLTDMDWRSPVVILNAGSASFADAVVYREGAEEKSDNILCALQPKKLKDPVSAKLLTDEHNKNLKAIKEIPQGSILDKQEIKSVHTVTVIITTADPTDRAFQELSKAFPDDCLLIYRGNFAEFFGHTFSLHAALSLTKDYNWNFATRETLKRPKMKYNLCDEEVDMILRNVPYRSYDDLIQKIPTLRSKGLDEVIGFLPYQDFQPEKRRRVG